MTHLILYNLHIKLKLNCKDIYVYIKNKIKWFVILFSKLNWTFFKKNFSFTKKNIFIDLQALNWNYWFLRKLPYFSYTIFPYQKNEIWKSYFWSDWTCITLMIVDILYLLKNLQIIINCFIYCTCNRWWIRLFLRRVECLWRTLLIEIIIV